MGQVVHLAVDDEELRPNKLPSIAPVRAEKPGRLCGDATPQSLYRTDREALNLRRG